MAVTHPLTILEKTRQAIENEIIYRVEEIKDRKEWQDEDASLTQGFHMRTGELEKALEHRQHQFDEVVDALRVLEDQARIKAGQAPMWYSVTKVR